MKSNNLNIFIGVLATFASSYACAELTDVRTATATVTFEVSIKTPHCTIETAPTKDGIFLGKISNREGTQGPIVPVRFKFSKCAVPLSIQKVEYTADVGYDSSSGSLQGNPTDSFVSTKLPAVKIKLWDDPSGLNPFKGRIFDNGHKIIDNEWVPICYAQAVVGKGQSQSSTFSGIAQFTVTYN